MNLKTLHRFTCLAAGLGLAHAEPVTGWVTTNGDAAFTAGSEATNSPVTTDADAETIVGSFSETTLAVGESLTLTGSVIISGNTGAIPGNQFRWGFFKAPGTPATGVGDGYVGVWAAASTGPADIRSADGSTGNPFSSSATITISTASDPDGGSTDYDESLVFSLTITRLNDSEIATSGSLSAGDDFLVEWPETTSPASPAGFTYDSVGILLGGGTNATSASFTDVEVSGASNGGGDLVFTNITLDPGSGDVSLTWTSTPDAIYAIDTSSNLSGWPTEIDDNIPASGEGDSTSFVVPAAVLGESNRLFFRVRDVSP